MLKFPLAGAVLIACAITSPTQAEQMASLDDSAARRNVQERCSEAAVSVTATSAEERHLACGAAAQALRLLARCNISPRRPLRIELSNAVRRPFGGMVFGLFDPMQEKVLITELANVASLASGTPFGELPPRVFYQSLIVHEVTHGIMHQNYKRPPGSHAAHEYAAYALQIESLPLDVRTTFLRSVNIGADGNEFAFNDSILAFDPFFFAARAHQHFRASTNGCAHLHALLEGEAAFIWTRPLTR